MDDLVKAVQALALAFERRGLEPPTIKVTQRASDAIAHEMAPMLIAGGAGSDLQKGAMKIAGIKIEEGYATNLGETFYGDHPRMPNYSRGYFYEAPRTPTGIVALAAVIAPRIFG